LRDIDNFDEGGGEWCRCLEGQCAAKRSFEMKKISLEHIFEEVDLPAGVYSFPD
jgi:hypothetical protein